MEDKIKSFNTPIDDDGLVLLFYKVAVSTKGNSFSGINEKALKRFREDIGFTTKFNDLDSAVKSHETQNHLVFERLKKNDSYILTMLRHFRNAFCHNNVKKNEDGTYTLQDSWIDKDTNRRKMTMFGNIDSDKLKALLIELEKLKK